MCDEKTKKNIEEGFKTGEVEAIKLDLIGHLRDKKSIPALYLFARAKYGFENRLVDIMIPNKQIYLPT